LGFLSELASIISRTTWSSVDDREDGRGFLEGEVFLLGFGTCLVSGSCGRNGS
jgi:hypothetical protein